MPCEMENWPLLSYSTNSCSWQLWLVIGPSLNPWSLQQTNLLWARSSYHEEISDPPVWVDCNWYPVALLSVCSLRGGCSTQGFFFPLRAQQLFIGLVFKHLHPGEEAEWVGFHRTAWSRSQCEPAAVFAVVTSTCPRWSDHEWTALNTGVITPTTRWGIRI